MRQPATARSAESQKGTPCQNVQTAARTADHHQHGLYASIGRARWGKFSEIQTSLALSCRGGEDPELKTTVQASGGKAAETPCETSFDTCVRWFCICSSGLFYRVATSDHHRRSPWSSAASVKNLVCVTQVGTGVRAFKSRSCRTSV